MVKFEKGTRDFLIREIKRGGVKAFSDYIDRMTGKRKTVSLRKKPSLKLAIFEDMFENKAFTRHAGIYFLPDDQMRKYRRELKKRMPFRRKIPRPVKRSKTFVILTSDPELGLGNAYPTIGNYIASKGKTWSVPEGIPENILVKLQILKEMFDRKEFSKDKKGHYLSPKDVEKYRQLYRNALILKEKPRKVEPSLYKEGYDVPWVRALASLPTTEKKWKNVSQSFKKRLASLLKDEIKQRFALNKNLDFLGRSDIEPNTLLAFAVGDFSYVNKIFSEAVFKRFQDMRSILKDDPKATKFILESAVRKTHKAFNMPSHTRMDFYENRVKDMPKGFDNILEELNRIPTTPKIKLPSWATPLPEQPPIEKWWSKLGKIRKDKYKKYVLWIAKNTFGLKVDLKGLKIPKDTLIGLRLQDKEKRAEADTIFQNAFVKSFFQSMWLLKDLSNLKPRDVHGAFLSAQNRACKVLNEWMDAKQTKMILAQRKLKGRRKAVA
jgi:hypothetical protein